MGEEFYASLAEDYDRMIRWERRLKTERPAFEALFSRFAVHTLLDASCGTGHHLVLFHSMGIQVRGSDASPEMVRLARKSLEKAQISPEQVPLAAATWSELPQSVGQSFDAVLCIGNSLPYVTDPAEMESSLRGLWSCVAPGGFLLIQFKNFEKLRSQNQRFLPLSWSAPPRETVALRLYDYFPERIDFNVILLDHQGEQWSMRHHVTPLAPYTPEQVLDVLEKLGARNALYGSLRLDDFERLGSEDVVVLATRAS